MAEKETDEATAKPSLIPKLLIPSFIAVVIVIETFIFFFLVPSADDVAALAESRLLEKIEAKMDADGEETIQDKDEIKEFNMGQYGIAFQPPGSDRKHRVEFELFGLVRVKDIPTVEQLFKDREGRFRDRMIEEVRNASMDDLNQLPLIKRRIFATSNDVLEYKTPLLQGVGFHNYFVAEE